MPSFSPIAWAWALIRRADVVAAGVALVAAATLVAAWGFQYIGGYIPCELCYQERVPYYIAIPLALIAAASAYYGGPAWLTRGALFLVGLAFAWGTYLAAYHTGVEWHFWPGPTDCSGDTANAVSTGDLLKQIDNIRVAQCDVVQWTMFGLSFAGWNTVISAGLTVAGLFGAFFTGTQTRATPAAAARA
jgi:disulfide bond formation protein DsbB